MKGRQISRGTVWFLCSTPNVNISEFVINAAIAQIISLIAYQNSRLSILYLLRFTTLYFVSNLSLLEQALLETFRATEQSVLLLYIWSLTEVKNFSLPFPYS
jgi:hypothetical protein